MRLNRRATFCLGITRHDIDRGIQPTAECVFAIQSRAGTGRPAECEYSARPQTGLSDDTMARTAFPVVVPASKSAGVPRGSTLSGPGLTRPLRCLVVKPKRALQSNRSA
jgi:hypothetical protein